MPDLRLIPDLALQIRDKGTEIDPEQTRRLLNRREWKGRFVKDSNKKPRAVQPELRGENFMKNRSFLLVLRRFESSRTNFHILKCCLEGLRESASCAPD